MKTCPKCNLEKDEKDFSKNKNRKDGLNGHCKTCHSIAWKAYRKNNKEKISKQVIDRVKTLKVWIKEYKSKLQCTRCGENEICCLDFHHRDKETKDLTISRAITNGWAIKRLLKEIEKCDIVCSNCHRKIHAGVV
jgi:hypothetical protein